MYFARYFVVSRTHLKPATDDDVLSYADLMKLILSQFEKQKKTYLRRQLIRLLAHIMQVLDFSEFISSTARPNANSNSPLMKDSAAAQELYTEVNQESTLIVRFSGHRSSA